MSWPSSSAALPRLRRNNFCCTSPPLLPPHPAPSAPIPWSLSASPSRSRFGRARTAPLTNASAACVATVSDAVVPVRYSERPPALLPRRFLGLRRLFQRSRPFPRDGTLRDGHCSAPTNPPVCSCQRAEKRERIISGIRRPGPRYVRMTGAPSKPQRRSDCGDSDIVCLARMPYTCEPSSLCRSGYAKATLAGIYRRGGRC